MTIKIVIADDHELVRLGLKSLFSDSDIRVVAEASDCEDAYKKVIKHRPNLALLDVRMPGGGGLTCLTRLKCDLPDLPVLMMSGHDNPSFVARAAALGASGFLSKEASSKEFLHAVVAAASGESLWTRDALRHVRVESIATSVGNDLEVSLTKREWEVLRHIAQGLTNKEIALALEISYETVKEHVQHTLRKLGVSDRTQAAVWAVRRNLV